MKSLTKGWKWLLGSVLTLLGFDGCVIIGDPGFGRCEYGQPYAEYKLIGDVKDAKGHPIQGIRVIHTPSPRDEYGVFSDTVYSDNKGHFEIERLKHDWPDDLKDSVVKFEDVDGAENGSFKKKELGRSELKIKQTQKGGRWFEGGYTVTADATLEEEQ